MQEINPHRLLYFAPPSTPGGPRSCSLKPSSCPGRAPAAGRGCGSPGLPQASWACSGRAGDHSTRGARRWQIDSRCSQRPSVRRCTWHTLTCCASSSCSRGSTSRPCSISSTASPPLRSPSSTPSRWRRPSGAIWASSLRRIPQQRRRTRTTSRSSSPRCARVSSRSGTTIPPTSRRWSSQETGSCESCRAIARVRPPCRIRSRGFTTWLAHCSAI
mmetsp:Transcript_165311/g.525325  ORF Transcript_165311/g.525325 Transcript_165311/m.525325 type:complete len:216 (+) Transcript_165311:518-1165(+)